MTSRQNFPRDPDSPQQAPGRRNHTGAHERHQARASDDTSRQKMPDHMRDESPGHHYEHVNVQDYARVHFGDTHIKQQHFYTEEDDEAKTRRQRDQLVQDLGFNMMETRLATIGAAHAYTCHWILSNEKYLRWRNPRLRSSHHGFLWIKGKPGAGKSTLMKYALRYMQSHSRDDSTILSFFFNARGHDLEKTTEGMYRSILSQLFAQLPQHLPEPTPRYPPEWNNSGWPSEVLQDWLRKAILEHGVERKFICYVDALDECEEDAIRQAIGNFEALARSASTRGIDFAICFASRHYPNITIKYNETINLDVEKEHQKDIALFVRNGLRGERALRHELGREISQRCSGVFLWAALVVQIVNQKTDHGATRLQLLDELSKVPSGIKALLNTLLQGSDSTALTLLQLVLFSVRTLTVPELYYALKTATDYQELDRPSSQATTDEQMRSFVLTMSRGLVEFTKDENSTDSCAAYHRHSHREEGRAGVQFIHETVREYLLNGGLVALDPGLLGKVESASHARLGRLCQSHIGALISSKPQKHTFLMYSMDHMLAHMERAYLGQAIRLSDIDAIPQSIWLAIRRYVDRDDNTTHAPNSLYIMVRARCETLAIAFLQRQLASNGCTRPTHGSTVQDSPSVNVNAMCGTSWRASVLLAALNNSSTQIVELILMCEANPNLAILTDWTPISVAIGLTKAEQKDDHVQLLLQHGADPDFPIISPPFSPPRTALAVAIRRGSKRLVELLLSFGASPNGTGLVTHLCLAVVWSQPAVVRALLAAGARVNDRDDCGRTALHEVISRKGRRSRHVRASIACILLDAGADVNAMDYLAETPVTLAFRRGRFGLVKLFFDRGADPNLPHHSDIFRDLRVGGNNYSVVHVVEDDSSDDSLTFGWDED